MAAPILTIADVARTYFATPFSITDQLSERSMFEVVVDDPTGVLAFERGHEVALTGTDGTVLFAGHVSEIVTTRHAGQEIEHHLRCTDYAAMAEKRVVASTYVSETVRAIVTDILADVLASEGVTGWSAQWLEMDGATDRAVSGYSTPITGDLEVITRIRAADYTPAALRVLAAHDGAATDRGWHFHLDTTGKLGLLYSTDGAATTTDLSTVTLASVITGLTDDTTGIWVRVVLDADNGATGRTVRFYYSVEGDEVEHDEVTWTQLGTDVTTAGTVALYSCASDMTAGVRDNSPTYSSAYDGRLYEAAIYDAGVLVANPRFDTYYRLSDEAFEWDEGDSSADDEQGNTWVVGGDAAITRTWTIDTGDTFEALVFDYITAAAALDLVCERVQWWWNIDTDKVLWVKPRTDTLAPVAVSPSTNIEKGSIEVTSTSNQYRNAQYVRGGQDTTVSQTEEFLGDGERVTFNVGFAVAEVPTVSVDTGGGYVDKVVGIRGLDTGKDWYWSKNTTEITQDSGGAVLTSAHTLRVVYVGLFGVVVYSTDLAEIAGKRTVEGGSGVFESVADDRTIEGRLQGFEVAAAYLAQFGADTSRLTFETRTAGFSPGQLLEVNGMDSHGIPTGDELLIESVLTEHRGNGVMVYAVTAVEGPPGQSWAQFFRFLVSLGTYTPHSLSSLELLAILATSSETWTWAESVVPTVNTCPLPDSTTYPEATLYPC